MITETELKMKDAAAQMRVALNTEDASTFRSCINSFISAARSITFVMERESDHPDLKTWYKEQTAKLGPTPLFRFFNSQRIYSIHKGVICPKRFSYPLSEVRIGDIANTRQGGKISVWIFDNVDEFMPDDSGNVFRLCEQYFLALKWLVQEWLKQRKALGLI
jgi:hypothetical protein